MFFLFTLGFWNISCKVLRITFTLPEEFPALGRKGFLSNPLPQNKPDLFTLSPHSYPKTFLGELLLVLNVFPNPQPFF